MTRCVPAVVATDLDGTLLRSDGTVGPRTLRALEAVQDAGATVVFVTGRPPRRLAPVADITGHRGVAICANGALVVDLSSGDVLVSHAFDEEIGLATLTRLREECPELVFGVEWADGFAHEENYPAEPLPSGSPREVPNSPGAARPPEGSSFPDGPRSPDVRSAAQAVTSVEDLFARPVVKLLARHHTLSADDLAERLTEVVDEVATVTHSSVGLLEISAAGITKAFALAQFVEERGLDAGDAIAFGDMPNDVPMLQWAGWAIAVANAHPDVRAIADEITASNDEDGVGVALERRLHARR